jgi:uncharacterized SAM-binding protein YcdF (DUF218 family)
MALVCCRQQPYQEVIVSGKDAAPGMRDFFMLNGVPADRVRTETDTTSTHENAKLTAQLFKDTPGSVVPVTSDDHAFRARRCFLKTGIPVSTSSVPDVTKRSAEYSARPQLFIVEVRETAAIVYYWCRGWI